MKPRKQPAFTLIELLVVIAIIAILASILFPVFAKARDNARRATALSNAKQMVLAVMQYVQDHDETLPFVGQGGALPGTQIGVTEWQEAILPYVKSEAAYKIPNDTTGYQTNGLSIADVASRTGELSACSFLMNLTVTRGAGSTRESHPLADFSAPADFILLVNGQRPRMTGNNSQRFSGARDHNGQQVSLWLAEYYWRRGGVNHLLSPLPAYRNALSSVPHHKDGFVAAFLDGHVKFYPVNRDQLTTLPLAALDSRLPVCHHAIVPQDDPACTARWNFDDQP